MNNKIAILLLSLFVFLSINVNTAAYHTKSNLLPPVNEADFCIIQSPSTITVSGGVTTGFIRGQIYEVGVTESPGASPLITAQVGYGTAGSDPRIAAGWTYFPAAFDFQSGQNDQYQGTMTSPNFGGTYSYVYRFSFDSGLNWSYADLDGAGTNPGLSFNPNNLGTMTVNAPTAASVSVSGRVLASVDGRGVSNAIVTLSDNQGRVRRVVTGRRGYFRFDDVEAGQTYVIAVRSRRFSFEPRIFSVTDDLTDVDFIPSP